MNGWIIVPGWDKFQHYHDRHPTWIKLYLDLQHREEWNQLTLAARGLLVSIWMEYASSGGVIKASEVSRDVRATTRRSTLDSLLSAGFITLSASKPLEQRREEKKRSNKKERKPVDNSEASEAEGEGVAGEHLHRTRRARPRLHPRRRVQNRRPRPTRRPDRLRPRKVPAEAEDNMNGDLEATKALNAALAEAQGQFPTIGREKTVKTGTYTFSYAELGTIIAAVRPVLVKHGLAISQQLEHNGTGPALRTELRHKEGGIITTTLPAHPSSRIAAAARVAAHLPTPLRHHRPARHRHRRRRRRRPGRPTVTVQSTQETSSHRRPAHHRTPNQKGLSALRDKLTKAGVFTIEAFDTSLHNLYGTNRVNELTREQARELIDRLEAVEPT